MRILVLGVGFIGFAEGVGAGKAWTSVFRVSSQKTVTIVTSAKNPLT
jgi:hypothetical protein